MNSVIRNGTAIPSRNRLKKLLRIVGWLALLGAVIVGPNLVFYYKWMRPDQPIPKVERDSVDQLASPDAAVALDFRAILQDSREKVGLPSLSAAIGFNGIVQWAGANGYSDIEQRIPATLRSRYRIGSVSKALTGVLLVRLVDAGQVEMDAPLSNYVQQMPSHLAPLTARQLASHRGGVRHYSMPSWWLGWWEMYSTQAFASVKEGLSLFRDDKLRFVPGEDFKYSTFGYSLLSRLMEGASVEDFPRLLKDQLFLPAGMRDSDIDRVGEMPQRVSFYSADAGLFTPAHPTDTSYKIAGGGLVSTPVDLVQLSMKLLGSEFLSAAGKQLLWTPVPLANGLPNPQNYAIGWRIDTAATRHFGTERPTRIFHHGGVQSGGAAFLMLVPEHDIAVAVVTNSGTGAARVAVQETAFELVRRAVASRRDARPPGTR